MQLLCSFPGTSPSGVGSTPQTDKRSTSLQRKVCSGIKLKPKLVPEKVQRRLSLIQLLGSHFVPFQPFLISEWQAHTFHFFIQHCQESVAITLCSLPYFMGFLLLLDCSSHYSLLSLEEYVHLNFTHEEAQTCKGQHCPEAPAEKMNQRPALHPLSTPHPHSSQAPCWHRRAGLEPQEVA